MVFFIEVFTFDLAAKSGAQCIEFWPVFADDSAPTLCYSNTFMP